MSSANTDEDQNAAPPLRVALLGTGLFATSTHIPFLLSNSSLLTCVAVWSRRLDRAEQVAAIFSETCPSFAGVEGFKDLLSDKRDNDIDAVIMALPLDVQPQFVIQCLEAGLHVFSEKPIAPSVAIGRDLVELYQRNYQLSLHWSVGENYRYEPGLLAARKALEEESCVGRPLLMSITSHLPFAPDNRYLQTEWRQNPKNGLFVDAFVHTAAVIRLLALGMGLDPCRVSATWSDSVGHIPGPDTLSALISFHDKEEPEAAALQGVVSATFAGVDRRFEISVTGTEGRLEVQRTWGEGNDSPGYEVTISGPDGIVQQDHYPFGGIEAELNTFVHACQANEGRALDRNTPEEALADLELVQAMLQSGKEQGSPQTLSKERSEF